MTALSETIELIEKAMEGGYWAASVHDCRPPHSRRDHPRKHSRVITLPEKFLTEQEALEAGVGAIASGWAGSTIVHRESATHSALFELDRHRVTELVRSLPAVLAAARKAEAMEREIAELRGLIRDNGTPRFNAVCERAEKAEACLRDFIKAHHDGAGLLDCVNNEGERYTSHFLGEAIRRARALLSKESAEQDGSAINSTDRRSTMNVATAVQTPSITIDRPDTARPVIVKTRSGPAISAGTTIHLAGRAYAFSDDTPVAADKLVAGENYGIRLDGEGKPFAGLLGPESPAASGCIAGFHFAPGGNAEGRSGGDTTPAINPHSIWDVDWRPACHDPRGMALDQSTRTWLDIYLLCVDHRRHGTSTCGVAIADGRSLSRLNYKDAVEIYASHGKRLATYDELRSAAFGVTERSAVERHPKTTGLDAARTSRIGLMQATGNVWQWCTDGDPDDPRPSLFGGSYLSGSLAGSRYADLGFWPGYSDGDLSARGACDHLGPA